MQAQKIREKQEQTTFVYESNPFPSLTMEKFFEFVGENQVWFVEKPEGPWGSDGDDVHMSVLGIASCGRFKAFKAITELFIANEGVVIIKFRKPDVVVDKKTGEQRWARGEDGHLRYTVTDDFGNERKVTLFDNYGTLADMIYENYSPTEPAPDEAGVYFTHCDDRSVSDVVEEYSCVTTAWAKEHGCKPGLRKKILGNEVKDIC